MTNYDKTLTRTKQSFLRIDTFDRMLTRTKKSLSQELAESAEELTTFHRYMQKNAMELAKLSQEQANIAKKLPKTFRGTGEKMQRNWQHFKTFFTLKISDTLSPTLPKSSKVISALHPTIISLRLTHLHVILHLLTRAEPVMSYDDTSSC